MKEKELLQKAQEKLDEKRKELEVLENEKADIMRRFQNATPAEQMQLKKQMDESETKFKKLLSDVTQIAEKIKLIKEKIVG